MISKVVRLAFEAAGFGFGRQVQFHNLFIFRFFKIFLKFEELLFACFVKQRFAWM